MADSVPTSRSSSQRFAARRRRAIERERAR
jgi:hypothetical protein